LSSKLALIFILLSSLSSCGLKNKPRPLVKDSLPSIEEEYKFQKEKKIKKKK